MQHADFKAIPEIVKLALQSLLDVVRTQGFALREIERIMPTKCNKSELNAALSLKANLADLNRTDPNYNNLASSKLQQLIEDKVSKSDF